MRALFGGLGLLLTAAVGWSQPVPGGDDSPWVEVLPGTLPLILTAPHGGGERPVGMAARRWGQRVMDAHTAELARELAVEMERRTGARPHVVICRVHRSRVDCNRDLEEAAQGDAEAAAVWRAYHAAVEVAVAEVRRQHGGGLLLDLHGHRHEEPNVELGYLLDGAVLRRADADLDGDPQWARASSIRGVVESSGRSLSALLRGPQSLGGLLEAEGQRCLPSPVRSAPVVGQAYFSGAYDIARHGSRHGGGVSAVQMECPWAGVRDTEENRRRFVQRLTRALEHFFSGPMKQPLPRKEGS
ncbi:MAG: hypothetical protein KDK99_09970 [Verrucomicrobiales bacterium]|nr:hypothetical protein [Verrucomicrobiales bacterium]